MTTAQARWCGLSTWSRASLSLWKDCWDFIRQAMRAFYDVKVFLDPPEDMRRLWKIKRDTAKRGYTPEQVLAEMERREADSRDFIRPQREFADIVVRFYPESGTGSDQSDGHLNVHLVLRPTHSPSRPHLSGDSQERPASGHSS